MKKILNSILLFLLIGLTSFAQLANWSPGSNPAYTNFPVNVSGQINGFCRISQMNFHASDPNKMYAVTGEGGFFTTTDGGNNWTVRPGTENLTGGCASLCIDYTNDQIIYLGSGDANYYSNGQGIYRSTNGGTSFTATTLTNCLVLEILQDPSNSATFVAATNKGIYKSINNGSTWTASTSTAIQFCDMVRNAAPGSSTLYACTRENSCRFFRSTDFGSTWTQITAGITTAVSFIQAGGRIGVTPADPNVVYFEAIGGGGIVHKSIDGGLNFTVSKPEGAGTLASPYITFYDFDNANTLTGQGNYNNAICVDANDPSKLWIQAHNTWLSNDNGVTWTEITHWSTKVHTDMHQLQQSPFDATKLYSCNDGGVWLSSDGGNNWTPKSNGLYAYEIYNNCGKSSNTDRNYIALGTQDNGRVFRNAVGFFTDRGGDDTRQKEFDYLPNGGFYYEKTQLNRKSVSNGSTASAGFGTTGNFWEYLAFNRSNTNLGFMWFTDNNLYRTTNLSAAPPTWASVFTFTANVTAMHSCIADPNRLYVITNDAKIQVCSNALSAIPTFSTFTLPSASNSLASIAAIANDANKVYISINNKVYYSSNGGATWTDNTFNLPSVNHRKILAEEFGGTQELVFIATNNAVYYKKAGQTIWTNYSTNLPSRRSPTNFTMYDDGTSQAAIRFYTYGRGVFESPFSNLRAISAQIAVNAEANPDCNTHTVTYGDASLGNIVSYAWSFPGGTPSTSTAPNPTVSYSANGTYNATLTVTDASSATSSQTISKSVQLIPVIKSALAISPSPLASTFCIGGAVNLTASGGVSPSFVELVAGASVSVGNSSSSTLGPNPLQNWYGGSKQLMLFTQVELNNLGLVGGAQISSFAVNMPAAVTSYVLQNLQVKIQNTALTNLSGFVASGWTVVRNSANYTLSGTGWNTIAFNSNYTWDGISSLLIEVNYSNNNGGSSGNTALYGATTNISTLLYRADNVTAAAVDTYSGTPTYSYSFRNNVRFTLTNTSTTYNWTPAGGLNVTTGTTVAASPSASATYTVTANSAGTCPVTTSQFITLLNYPISASTGANGIITPSGTTNVNCGLNQAYSFTPNSGFVIQDVLVDGVSQGAISTYTFTNVTAAHTISVSFIAGANTITASAGANGSISPSGAVSVALGANQTFSISPNSCYQIADVLVDGISQGPLTTYTFTNVTTAHTISASFTQLNYNIVASSGANGIITPSGTTNVNCGLNQSYSFTPNGGFVIQDVLVDGVSQGAISSYTFSNVTAAHTINVSFVAIVANFTITASAGPNGSITPNGAVVIAGGASQTFNISAAGGFTILDVLVDGISQGPISSKTFSNVTANHTIQASFAPIPAGTTTLNSTSCNSTVATMNDQLFIFPLAGATDYRYKVENSNLGFSSVYVRNSSLTDFRMKWAPGVLYGTTYAVSVAGYVGGVWNSYGAPCNVTIGPFPTTQLAICNITLSSLSDAFNCIAISGASDYQYRFTNVGLSYSYELYRNTSSTDMRLSWLPVSAAAQYGRTYGVEVRAKVGNTWGTYGALCQVTTPAAPLTSLLPAFCTNYVLPTFSSAVNCTQIPGASNYRYHITGPLAYNKTFTRNSSLNDWRFSWTLLCCGQQNMLANSTYSVEVAYYAGGVWSNYGALCTIVTPGTVPRYAPSFNEGVTVEESQDNFSLLIIPNPSSTNESITLIANGVAYENGSVDISIVDMLGKTIYKDAVQSKMDNRIEVKPALLFSSGVYMVQMNVNGQLYREKFIVK
jgi:PKD domain/Secretion system C-terminal sorting domain